MLTQQQLDTIDAKLQMGYSPELIACEFGVTRPGLTHKLLSSGKRIEVVRRLVDTGPLDVSTHDRKMAEEAA